MKGPNASQGLAPSALSSYSSPAYYAPPPPPSVCSEGASNEVVCEVLSPHPSYKLLVVSTTVKIFNYSGLPLQFCFLDSTLRPLLLPAAEAGKARTDEVLKPSEGGEPLEKSSYRQFSCSHPELKQTPSWLRKRDLLVQQRVWEDIHSQVDNLVLLDHDAASSSSHVLRRGDSEEDEGDGEERDGDGDRREHEGTEEEEEEDFALRSEEGDDARGGREAGVGSSSSSRGHRKAMDAEGRGGGVKTTLRGGGDERKERNEGQRGERGRQKDAVFTTSSYNVPVYTYTFLLEDKQFMSVPQQAILGAGWCYLCFRPACFAQEGEEDPSPPSPSAGRRGGEDVWGGTEEVDLSLLSCALCA